MEKSATKKVLYLLTLYNKIDDIFKSHSIMEKPARKKYFENIRRTNTYVLILKTT